MSTRLYVGNLNFRTTSDELREIFSQAGEVENASVVEDRDTGRSKCSIRASYSALKPWPFQEGRRGGGGEEKILRGARVGGHTLAHQVPALARPEAAAPARDC